MNAPIFNPIWFYLIEIFDRFGMAFIIVGLTVFCVTGVVSFCCFMDEEPETAKKIMKLAVISVVFAIIGGLTPSKETCYKMIVASYITPNNINTVKGEATDLIDYIVDKIDELNDEEKKDD